MKELAWSGEAVFRFLSCVHLFWWQSPVPLNYQKSKFAQLCLHAPVFRIKIFQPQCAALCPWSQQLWVCASGSRFPLPVWSFLYQTFTQGGGGVREGGQPGDLLHQPRLPLPLLHCFLLGEERGFYPRQEVKMIKVMVLICQNIIPKGKDNNDIKSCLKFAQSPFLNNSRQSSRHHHQGIIGFNSHTIIIAINWNSRQSIIFVVSPEFAVTGSICREGRKPGQLSSPTDLVFESGDIFDDFDHQFD